MKARTITAECSTESAVCSHLSALEFGLRSHMIAHTNKMLGWTLLIKIVNYTSWSKCHTQLLFAVCSWRFRFVCFCFRWWCLGGSLFSMFFFCNEIRSLSHKSCETKNKQTKSWAYLIPELSLLEMSWWSQLQTSKLDKWVWIMNKSTKIKIF